MQTHEIKNRSKEILNRNYGLIMPCVLLAVLIPSIVTSINEESGLLTFIALSPIPFGLATILLQLQKKQSTSIEKLFSGYSKHFFNILILNFCVGALTVLGFALLVVPGIVIALRYSMVWFILAENPNLDFREVMRRSRAMMEGRKEELFYFIMSYLGWFILSGMTAGILFVLYVGPYFYLALTGFYLELKVPEKQPNRPKPSEPADDSYEPPQIGGAVE